MGVAVTPNDPTRAPSRALGLMALGAILFSLMNFFARLATTTASWSSVAAVRSLVGALIAVAVARARGASLAARDRRALFWRSLLGTISMLSTFYVLSSRTVSLGDTVTLLNLAPVFLAVLAPIFLRERTTLALGGAIAIALLGVILVVRPAFLFGVSGPAPLGVVAGPSATTTVMVAVLAALSTSIAMMFLRRVGKTESAESIAFWFSLFAAATTGAISLFNARLPSPRDLGLMVLAGLAAGFGQLAMTRAYALENAARVSGMSYLAVVASALLGAVALGERPPITALFGMSLVITGGLLITFARSAKADPDASFRDSRR